MIQFAFKRLHELASSLGFDMCGVVQASSVPFNVENRVERWINCGYNGTMEWFNRNKPLRYNPQLLHEGCKSVIVCGISYQTLNSFNAKGVSDYAQQTDYHYLIKDMLSKLNANLAMECGKELNSRPFCDSAPILERYWAVQAGLGWIGRNSMLVNREFGSWTLLGVLLTDLEFDSYCLPNTFNGCGSCNKCVESCPNGAILENGVLDSTKCTAYLTIEHKGDYTLEQKQIIDNSEWFFGCDNCIKACPWNVKAMNNLSKEVSEKRVFQFERKKYIFPSTIEQLKGKMIKELKKTPLSRFNFQNK